jgi:lipid A ethanolaminephosphotransferase
VIGNGSLWKTLWRTLGGDLSTKVAPLSCVAVALWALFAMLFHLCAWPRVAKPAWTLLLVVTMVAAYFMDSYGLVVDRVAIQSVLETDAREAFEWFSLRMLPYALGAVVPIAWLWRRPLRHDAWPLEVGSKLLVVLVASVVIAGCTLAQFPRLSSLARNHRELQHMINPTTVLQSVYGLMRRRIAPRPTQVQSVLTDAHLGPSWAADPRTKRRLLVLVVGESARASSFSLLGYARLTNPRLAQEDVIGFDHVRSCGTSTAVSLPCMFTDLGEARYSDLDARGRESVLDVLERAGLDALWFDNNTGSKNVAARVGQVSVAAELDPRYCTAGGCFDDILVERLRAQLQQDRPPAVIVLHQKGSHGPSYFERYPAAFRKFAPTCESNELADCTRQQILNTYDNSILYTDHNLAEIIGVLREHAARFDSAMLYLSDHGESTGENGMYLHGAPKFMAPDEQTRVPMVLWLSSSLAADRHLDSGCLRSHRNEPLSHDLLFHSVLGLLDVHTRGYQTDLDLFAGCHRAFSGAGQLAGQR